MPYRYPSVPFVSLVFVIQSVFTSSSPSLLPPSLSNFSGTWQSVRICAATPSSPRISCGIPGTTEQTCIDTGCCWESSNRSLPWCYVPNYPGSNDPLDPMIQYYGSNQAIPSVMALTGGIHAAYTGDVASVTCGAFPPYVQECDYDYGTLDNAYGFPYNFSINQRLPSYLPRYRWTPYGILRSNVDITGTQVTSEVRLLQSLPVVLINISVGSIIPGDTPTITAYIPLQFRDFSSSTWGWDHPQQSSNLSQYRHTIINTTATDNVPFILSQDTLSSALSLASVWSDTGSLPVVSLQPLPSLPTVTTSDPATAGHVQWQFTVENQIPYHFGFVVYIGRNLTEGIDIMNTLGGNNFPSAWLRAQNEMDTLWTNMFTPGNSQFSGSLPVLPLDNPTVTDAMVRVYYMSVLSVLQCIKSPPLLPNSSSYPYKFIVPSAAPIKAVTTVYLWDTSYASPILYRLEPQGMLTLLEGLFNIDIHNHYALDTVSLQGVGPWYSFNDLCGYLLLTNAWEFARNKDDAFWLQELAGKRVIDWMDDVSTYWQTLPSINITAAHRRLNVSSSLSSTDVFLADYGLADNLLECVPTYLHAVPSLNAANVLMMNTTAAIWNRLGNTSRATYLQAQADNLLFHVMDLYQTGKGYWACAYPDGSLVSVQHVIDFFTVAESIGIHFTPTMQDEMLNFLNTALLTDTWMRALSLSDPAAPASQRADHGAYGAYDGWPCKTIDGLLALGKTDEAIAMFDRIVSVLDEGPFGQSHRVYGNPLIPNLQTAKSTTDQQYGASVSASFAATILRILNL